MSTEVEFHVPDFDIEEKFYTALGFKRVWRQEPFEKNGYMVLSNGSSRLCFWPGNDELKTHEYFGNFDPGTKRGFGVEVVVMAEDLKTTYEAAQELDCVVEEWIDRPWGLSDFRIEDPFGFYIRFTTVHDVSDESYAVSHENE